MKNGQLMWWRRHVCYYIIMKMADKLDYNSIKYQTNTVLCFFCILKQIWSIHLENGKLQSMKEPFLASFEIWVFFLIPFLFGMMFVLTLWQIISSAAWVTKTQDFYFQKKVHFRSIGLALQYDCFHRMLFCLLCHRKKNPFNRYICEFSYARWFF